MAKSRDLFMDELSSNRDFLMKYARKLCANNQHDAEDLVSDTVLRAIRYRSNYKMGTNMRGWLVFIQRNLFLTARRRSIKFEAPNIESMDGYQGPCVDAPQEHFVHHRDAMEALMKLSAEQRQAVCLVGSGVSYEEAAAEAGVALGTIKSRVARGREALAGLTA